MFSDLKDQEHNIYIDISLFSLLQHDGVTDQEKEKAMKRKVMLLMVLFFFREMDNSNHSHNHSLPLIIIYIPSVLITPTYYTYYNHKNQFSLSNHAT